MRPRSQNGIVEDAQTPQVVVDFIVAAFHQLLPSTAHFHRALRDVESAQGDFRRNAGLVSTLDYVAVFFLEFLRPEQGRVVQFLINVLVGDLRWGILDFFEERRAKGFQDREHDPSRIGVDG